MLLMEEVTSLHVPMLQLAVQELPGNRHSTEQLGVMLARLCGMFFIFARNDIESVEVWVQNDVGRTFETIRSALSTMFLHCMVVKLS